MKKFRFILDYIPQFLIMILCLSMLTGFFPALTAKAEDREKLSGIVTFQGITLHYDDGYGRPGAGLKDGVLIKDNDKLVLRYAYEITEAQCGRIKAGTRYYLVISPHLVLPDLESGSPLTINDGGEQRQFGMIYADGSSAWVVFDQSADSTGTVLSEYGGISGAYFYLDCSRAGDIPAEEAPIEGKGNLYAMKFEDGKKLEFGYAEQEPIKARAKISKGGSLAGKTITWSIDYTPWQNPSGEEGITMDTPFELRDRLDTALHKFKADSVKIGDVSVQTYYTSRDNISGKEEAYVLVEADGNSTVLTFGGTKFQAVASTGKNPAQQFTITYDTVIRDELLLPLQGGGEEQKITNAAELFAGTDGMFHKLDISGKETVTVPQPQWLTKTGKTERHTDGTGSTTEWTVTFNPNGFTFDHSNGLTLHDELPEGSILAKDTVKADGASVTASEEGSHGFKIEMPEITGDKNQVTVTYTTSVSEDMYDSGTGLGNNTAWFTFSYDGKDYETPHAETPVGSGDGSGKPGTDILVKNNGGYDAKNRTISWIVTINPHKAYFKSGTFTDDLGAVGGGCQKGIHEGGLELSGGINDVKVCIDGNQLTDSEKNLVELDYQQKRLLITVGEIGARTVTIHYTTKVCDPCIFANNTKEKSFINIIFTDNMVIGKNSTDKRPHTEASSEAKANAAVLEKKPPVYDYASRTMKWTVEVDASGLPMTGVTLKDVLPAGLTYKTDSLVTAPTVQNAKAEVSGQELTITLGSVSEKTTVTFDTAVNPEKLGFSSNGAVTVANTIKMNGSADGVRFAEVSHRVEQRFTNHGLVKSSNVNNGEEWIRYEVLINPFGLSLSENPSLVDTLDKRLQLDGDTLRFYKATLSGTTENQEQKPAYTKEGDGQSLKVTGYDPESNSFTVSLPISKGSRDAYVLTYTADIIEHEAGGYGNSVRFEGGSVLLGGSKNNSASVGGGGGGGGGGVAARKAGITVTKRDSENQKLLTGVTFTLYEWDEAKGVRGLPFFQGITDAQGKISFKVKPGKTYELAETGSLAGYDSKPGWEKLPAGVSERDSHLLITAGAAGSDLKLELTNEVCKTDLVFRLFNESGIPMTGSKSGLFLSDPAGQTNPHPDREAIASTDGTVRFAGMRRGETYFIQKPGGGIMKVEIPADVKEEPKIVLPDGTKMALADYRAVGTMAADAQWSMTVNKVISGSTEPLAGAVFGLYAERECRTLIKKAVSGQDGTIVFSGLIRGQAYWIKEIEAPANYRLDSTVYEVSETDTIVTASNAPKPLSGESGRTGSPDDAGRGDGSEGLISATNSPETGDCSSKLALPGFLLGILLSMVTVYGIYHSLKVKK